MHLEDVQPSLYIWTRYIYVAVKATRTSQGWVEHIRSIGGGYNDHSLGRGETIHLDQQLVKGLILFHFTASAAGVTLPSDGVDLVNENNAGRFGARLFEQRT